MQKGYVFDIERFSISNGPGIRTTVFFKGCNLRCVWCHNPESQSAKKQMLFYKEKCTLCGKCSQVCPYNLKSCDFCGKCTIFCPNNAREICGVEYTSDQVFAEIIKYKAFYDNSDGGVTFSGGECMLQIDFLCDLLKKCKENGIHTAVDTAGYVPWKSFEAIMPYTDLFLYDVKSIDPEVHKKYTGAENALILENLRKLLHLKAKIWIRIPVIPTVNDTEGEMEKVKKFFEENGCPAKIELLPYHTIGENKYHALGQKPQKFDLLSKEKLETLQNIVFPY